MGDPEGTPGSVRSNAIPTNVIHYKSRKIPARIDAAARIGYIVEIMANSFGTSEHHITLCLRDESDNLVTQSALASKVVSQEALKLVPSPTTEALSVVTSLQQAVSSSLDPSPASPSKLNGGKTAIPLKLALFNLSKYVKEEEFAVEFMIRGGTKDLLRLIEQSDGGLSGNTLAYALQGVRGLLEFEAAWADIGDDFIDRLLVLLVTVQQTNVLRPATAVIRKLVISTSQAEAKSRGKGKARIASASNGDEEKHSIGFERVWARMQVLDVSVEGPRSASGVFKVLSKRLEGTGDLELVAQSLGLINACLRSAHQEDSSHYQELVALVEILNVRKYVSRLIPTSSNNIVEPQIHNFQSRYAAILDYHRRRPVRGAQHPEQEKMLADIWRLGRLGEDIPGMEVVKRYSGLGRTAEGWRRIGLVGVEDNNEEGPFLEVELFRDVGELGLECLHYFATHEENFYNLIIEQEARPIDRRCEIGLASAECVKILCDHYKVSQPFHTVPAQFQLFLLNFSRLHSLVVKFFMRMWHDSESRSNDFDKVSLLVRTQVRLTLADESSKTWLNLEKDFLEVDYRTVRDQQMHLLEKEDGMLAKSSIRELRNQLGKEASDVVAEQRVGCMIQGAWFNSAAVIVPGIISSHKPLPSKPLRFVRLSPNRRTLAWAEFAQRPTTPPSFDSLREKIDLANVTELRLQTGCPINTRSPNLISKLSFSLMSGSELSLLDLDAIHAAQLAEWTDGIRVIRGEGGMGMKETSSYIQILAELALKVRLLDVTGDGIELPEKVAYGLPPRSVDFWFAK